MARLRVVEQSDELRHYVILEVFRVVVTRIRPECNDVEAQPLSEGTPDEGDATNRMRSLKSCLRSASSVEPKKGSKTESVWYF